jgi:predicted nucleic-acid-binding protein
MIVLDANYVLRYLLRDDEAMFLQAKEVISQEVCFLLNEVLAEVVYVLQGVYKVPKQDIVHALSAFVSLSSISMYESKSIIFKALQLFESRNLDFVDCCLCALKEKYEVKSFDKKLMKCVQLDP